MLQFFTVAFRFFLLLFVYFIIKGFLKQATAMFITLQTTSVSEQRVSYCIALIPINVILAVCVCSRDVCAGV